MSMAHRSTTLRALRTALRMLELSHPHPMWLTRLLCLESGPSPSSSTAAHAAAQAPICRRAAASLAG